MALMKRIGSGAGAGLNAAQIAFLKDEDLPDGEPYAVQLEYDILTAPWADHAPAREHPAAAELWKAHGAAYLAQHIKVYPGTRPAPWWRFDAPEPLRERIGGIGTPRPSNQRHLGVELLWVTAENATWWGEPAGPAIDPANPPIFESQATFLDRHGFLTAAERAKLTDDDFATEAIDAGDDE
jgi:hypothetical protein